MKTTVKIEGKNPADLLALQCVRSIEKMRNGILMLTVQSIRNDRRATAYEGDSIEYDNEHPEYGIVKRASKNYNLKV